MTKENLIKSITECNIQDIHNISIKGKGKARDFKRGDLVDATR